MAQEQGLDDRIALTAEKIRAGKTSLGIEFGSTRIKAVLHLLCLWRRGHSEYFRQ